jgi:Cytochrome c554 and c-prime
MDKPLSSRNLIPGWIIIPCLVIASLLMLGVILGPAPDDSQGSAAVDSTLPLAAGTLPAHVSSDTLALFASAEHIKAFSENRFPSANTCATCHPDHFREWSVSQHAYSQMSPVFNAFHGTVLKITNGTNGDFCIRCHTPVGMNLGEPEFMSNMDRFSTSREGVTCIVCHRLQNSYGKVSGRLAIVEGDIFDPVFGPTGNAELNRVIDSDSFRVNTERGQAGRPIHTDAIKFPQLDTPALCATCHDVNLVNGFRLEEAFSEYKDSPASANGVTCQDCHMGKEPGVPSGYATAPAAKVGARYTRPRKRTSHMFAGPDYSIIHTGIFPHNVEASGMATIREWLTFDVDAGWGTEEFEDDIPEGFEFPERWEFPDDRFDARDVISDNEALLEEADVARLAILRAGYVMGEIETKRADNRGIEFRVEISNGTDGHNVPTGFDAERLVFLQVTVTDADGKVVFVSGDRDPNGDIRDLHSLYVHNGELPLDKQLFSLQSKFLVRMTRGGEREQVIALNYSPDPLPFLRPSTRSTILLGRPTGARKHRVTLPPLAARWAEYQVDRDALAGSRGPYTANVKLIAQMIPVNLIPEIKDVGFDYFMSPRDIADGVVEGARLLWERDVVLQ